MRAMLRSVFAQARSTSEHGQAIVLFTLGLVGLVGVVAMSVDVGRLVWARTSMQSSVDAAALAAAGSMPDTSAANTQATKYWDDNAGFIKSQGTNIHFTTTFPSGTDKGVTVHGDADIPTWFAKVFGLNNWHVAADGSASSTYLDLAVVLDISGSMCDDSYPETETAGIYLHMSPGRTASIPKITQAIAAGGAASITIKVNNVTLFNSATTTAGFGYTSGGTKYYQYTYTSGARAGMIMIDNELFQITSINAGALSMVVSRAKTNNFTGAAGVAVAHAVNAEVWMNRSACLAADRNTPTSSVLGPNERYDTTISDAKYFTTLFNSTYDKFALTSFTSTANPRGAGTMVNLTNNFGSVTSAMDSFAYPDGGTNSATGIAVGRQLLDGAGKRANATRVMLFITDGRANAYCGSSYLASNYNTTACPSQGSGADGNASAVNAAIQEATRAYNDAGGKILIYVIGLGTAVDDAFLQQIATIGHGQYFKAPTLGEIQGAFTSVSEQTHIALTQ